VEGDLGIVGAGLDADVAAAFPGLQRVAGQRRQRLQRRGALAGEAEPRLIEQARAEAEGDGEAGREEADGLAGVVGRRQRHVVDVADHLAVAGFSRGPRPFAHQLAQLRRVFRQQVEGGEVEAVLGGGGDSRLVLAVEGDGAGPLPIGLGLGKTMACQEPPASKPDRRGAHAGGCQQAAAIDLGHRRQGVLATGLGHPN
jgi:hypothetical protein